MPTSAWNAWAGSEVRAARLAMAPIARWDRATAHRVHHYVANSRHVAARIARYYNRESTVLHPPVDTSFFTPDGAPPSSTFLVVSALVPYKRLDVAIDAASRIGAPLTVVGDGPDLARLRARAGATVQFLGLGGRQHAPRPVPPRPGRDPARRRRLRHRSGRGHGVRAAGDCAVARRHPGHGRPRASRACSSTNLSADAFADAMAALDRTAFDPAQIRAHAERFDTARFETGVRAPGRRRADRAASRMLRRHNRLLVVLLCGRRPAARPRRRSCSRTTSASKAGSRRWCRSFRRSRRSCSTSSACR